MVAKDPDAEESEDEDDDGDDEVRARVGSKVSARLSVEVRVRVCINPMVVSSLLWPSSLPSSVSVPLPEPEPQSTCFGAHQALALESSIVHFCASQNQ